MCVGSVKQCKRASALLHRSNDVPYTDTTDTRLERIMAQIHPERMSVRYGAFVFVCVRNCDAS